MFKTQLGPMLNGVVNFETWLPLKSMAFPGSLELLKKYQERAKAAGTDPLGYYMPVWAYADLQVLGDAIAATKSLNDDVLAAYMHKTTFKTVVGDVKFNEQGEWAEEQSSSRGRFRQRSARWRPSFRTSKAIASTTSAI